MTNRADLIIPAIEVKLLNAGVKKCARYPEQYPQIGNLYPIAIIKEGTQRDLADSGLQYMTDWNLSIVLVSNATRSRSDAMSDLETAVFNQLFADNTLGGLAIDISPSRVSVGGLITGSEIQAQAGYTEVATHREIELVVRTEQSR